MMGKISEICIKCGTEDAKIEFKGECAKVEEIETLGGNREVFIREPINQENEILLLTCNCCGYVWLEKPLDNELRRKEEINMTTEMLRGEIV